jgi:hypothetical protein
MAKTSDMPQQPERVIVKDCDCKLLKRWMIGRDNRVAHITNDLGASDVLDGRTPQAVIGFPLRDVFFPPDDGEELVIDKLSQRFYPKETMR